MSIVSSVDYPNKRIYLDISTANTSIDTLDVYREVRALRRTNENHRKFKPMIIAGGNIPKIPGISYTPAFVQLLYGCRIVPYNTNQVLTLVRDTFTDDGYSGKDVFDRSSITAKVDIDVNFPVVEIRTISTGSGLTPEQSALLQAISNDTSLIPILL